MARAAEGACLAAAMADPQPFPVSYTRALQREAELREAIAAARASHGAQRGIDRRYAMRLLAAERKRRGTRIAATFRSWRTP